MVFALKWLSGCVCVCVSIGDLSNANHSIKFHICVCLKLTSNARVYIWHKIYLRIFLAMLLCRLRPVYSGYAMIFACVSFPFMCT